MIRDGIEKQFEDGVVDIDKKDLPELEAQQEQQQTNETPKEEVDDFVDIGDKVETEEPSADAQEGLEPETSESPLELIAEDEPDVSKQPHDSSDLPEGVDKLVKFINETGGTVEEYMNLNRDYASMNQESLLRDFYKNTKSHLEDDDIDYLINKRLDIDEEGDEDSVREGKIALKEELSKAKKYLENQKEQYYAEIKSRGGSSDEIQALKQKEVQEQQFKQFQEKTNEAFKGFKGFEFDLGEKRKPVRYRINDVDKLKTNQQSLDNVFGEFFESGELTDAVGFHKAAFAASNADNIASLFFEQGYAQAVEELQKTSKNLDFEPTKLAPSSDSKLKPGQAREIQQPKSSGGFGLQLKHTKF